MAIRAVPRDIEMSTVTASREAAREAEGIPSAARATATKVDHLRPGAYQPKPIAPLSGAVHSSPTVERIVVAIDPPPSEVETMMVVLDEPSELRIFNSGGNGAFLNVESSSAEEMKKVKACFQRMKIEIFQHLVRNGELREGDWGRFKLEILESGLATWVCGDQREKIDCLQEIPTLTMQKELELFRTLLRNNQLKGRPTDPLYLAGYMTDVRAKNGFAITSPQLREQLPKTMGGFLEGHLEKILGPGATQDDYYRKMRDLAIMDCHRKAAISGVKKAIKKLDNAILKIGDGPHDPRTRTLMVEDKKRLEGILENLTLSDQFAVNFAACFQRTKGTRIEAAYEFSEAAKKHLEGIRIKGWITSDNLKLTPEDDEYCDLIGTLMLQDRIGFHTYCDQKRINYGNTAIEHNFLLANLEATTNGDRELQGMEMFSGLHNEDLIREIRTEIQTQGRDKANEILEIVRNRPAAAPDTKPQKMIAHFKEHVYQDGWK